MNNNRRALLSVSDKTDILPLATALEHSGFQILSTGGTAKLLREAGISVTDVAEITGFPEIMGGRVKTLHPLIHGGILARRGQDEGVMAEHNIGAIDIVVVNLYPFSKTIANPECTLAEAIEEIDIGGPAMLRAAAKNHRSVAVVVDPTDYPAIIAEIEKTGEIAPETRFDLARKAFHHTAQYDGAIARYLDAQSNTEAGSSNDFPTQLNLEFTLKSSLRYGENPHQNAAFYIDPRITESGISTAKLLQGKALSYNNIADADAALECIKQFTTVPACVIVKHANPCGVACHHSLLEAYEAAWSTDSESAFGGIIAFNQELDAATASAIIGRQFVEVIIAPSISTGAREVLQCKKNIRVMACGKLPEREGKHWDCKRVHGGLLVQDADQQLIEELRVVSQREPSEKEMQDLMFCWRVAKFVKSNAIVYAREQRTIGVGAGQMSRVNSARIAVIKAEQAGLEVAGSVMASDAFFPFRDSVDHAASAGITAIIQPGGSIRDEEVITAANEHDIAMVFTGMRHFRH